MLAIAGALGAAKAAGLDSLLGSVGSGLSKAFGGGPTAIDRRRDAHADMLMMAAINGDASAVRQLEYEWLEKRQGKPGDARTPVDGKYSPGDVRDEAKAALVEYYRVTGVTPPASYASKLGIPIPSRPVPLGQRIVQTVTDPIVQAVGDAAVESAAEKANANATRLFFYAAGIVVIFVIATAVTNRSLSSGK